MLTLELQDWSLSPYWSSDSLPARAAGVRPVTTSLPPPAPARIRPSRPASCMRRHRTTCRVDPSLW